MTDRLAEKLAWFVERLDSPPMQLHMREVWHDHDDGAGSVLGSLALSPKWRQRLESDSGTVTLTEEILCYHVGRSNGALCEVCAIRDGDGKPIAESGVRKCEREVYRTPMLAAIASLNGAIPAEDRPCLAFTLTALARAGGDAAAAAEFLCQRWPVMGDPITARAHFLLALDRVRGIWPKYAPC